MSKIIFTEEGTKPPAPSSGQVSLYVKTDEVVYVQNSAGTETALGSASAITQLTGDVTAAGPGSSVATVVTVGGSSASNIHTAELAANGATSSNTVSKIVIRDGSGNFSAGTISAALSGNATTATTAGSATNFSGSLSGDVTGAQGATIVTSVGGSSATNVHSAELVANAATSVNTVGTIVKRDGSGNFTASSITANLIGNATNVSGTVAIANGGTGQTTANAAFNALSPNTTKGDLIAYSTTNARVPIGSDGQFLLADSGAAAGVSWQAQGTSFNLTNNIVRRDGAGGFSSGFISATGISTASGTGSEVFGANNTCTGSSNVILGSGNSNTGSFNVLVGDTINGIAGTQNVALGYGISIIGSGGPQYNLAIGSQTQINGSHSMCFGFASNAIGSNIVAIGDQAFANGDYSTVIGAESYASGPRSTCIGFFGTTDTEGTSLGYGSTATGSSVALGAFSATTAAMQLVAGNDAAPINDIYFGKGVASATAGTTTIHGTKGSGADNAGGALALAGGNGTGSAAGGEVNIQVSAPGASGSSVNSLDTVASFTATGNNLGISGGASVNQINGAITATTRTVSTTFTVDTTTTDCILFADTSGGAFTITLPAPTNGRLLYIKDSTGNFATNNLTISPHAGEKIEGVASNQILNTNWSHVQLTSNGTDWFFI